jgi:hypothetical protein
LLLVIVCMARIGIDFSSLIAGVFWVGSDEMFWFRGHIGLGFCNGQDHAKKCIDIRPCDRELLLLHLVSSFGIWYWLLVLLTGRLRFCIFMLTCVLAQLWVSVCLYDGPSLPHFPPSHSSAPCLKNVRSRMLIAVFHTHF